MHPLPIYFSPSVSVCVQWCRCISNIPDHSDDSAVRWAAGLLCAEGRTQSDFTAAGGVTGAAAQFLGEDRNKYEDMHLCMSGQQHNLVSHHRVQKLSLQNILYI